MYGGDSMEQMLRLSLQGVEFALKIAGGMAKHVSIALYTAIKNIDKAKTKGKTRLISLLKSEKPLTILTIRKENLPDFQKTAKKYGILYSAVSIKNDSHGFCDIVLRNEDAPRINRVAEILGISSLEMEQTEKDITTSQEKMEVEKRGIDDITSEDIKAEISVNASVFDEHFGVSSEVEILDESDLGFSVAETENPLLQKGENLSEPLLKKDKTEKPSVKNDLGNIKVEQKIKERQKDSKNVGKKAKSKVKKTKAKSTVR